MGSQLSAACKLAGVALASISLGTLLVSFMNPGFSVSRMSAGVSERLVHKEPIASIHMVNAKDGWGFTATSILTTTDGGGIWKYVTPEKMSKQPAPFHYLMSRWPDGWVTVQNPNGSVLTLYHTADGGRRWAIHYANTHSSGLVSNFGFISGSDGWITLTASGGMGHMTVTLLKTSDGGTRWTMIPVTSSPFDVSTPPGMVPTEDDKNGVVFSSSNRGWLTGYSYRMGRLYLYRTLDGGAKWRFQNVPLLRSYHSNYLVERPQFFSSKDGALLTLTNSSNPPLRRVSIIVYRTINGGNTWNPVRPLVISNDQGLAAVWQMESFARWYVVNGRHLLETSDGGKMWRIVSSDFNFTGVKQIDFISKNVGWVVTNRRMLYKTTDGGKHFNLQAFP
ncbi:MAG: WD40/YVTN/BNR-like repeat-containing protein [Bacilli bacterium]